MGWFSSSEENTEVKLVDTNGQVNNNIIIHEARNMHTQAALSEKLLFATYVLVTLEIIKLAICTCMYNTCKKQIKNRYNKNDKPTSHVRTVYKHSAEKNGDIFILHRGELN